MAFHALKPVLKWSEAQRGRRLRPFSVSCKVRQWTSIRSATAPRRNSMETGRRLSVASKRAPAPLSGTAQGCNRHAAADIYCILRPACRGVPCGLHAHLRDRLVLLTVSEPLGVCRMASCRSDGGLEFTGRCDTKVVRVGRGGGAAFVSVNACQLVWHSFSVMQGSTLAATAPRRNRMETGRLSLPVASKRAPAPLSGTVQGCNRHAAVDIYCILRPACGGVPCRLHARLRDRLVRLTVSEPLGVSTMACCRSDAALNSLAAVTHEWCARVGELAFQVSNEHNYC